MSNHPLPRAWVDRLFARFFAVYGAVKLAGMWPQGELDAAKTVWSEQLGRFQPGTIRDALQALIDSGREWPPTLAEFVELCRQCAVVRAQSASVDTLRLTNGGSQRDDAAAGVVREAIGRAAKDHPSDPRFWAKHPKSAQAVRLLARGCEREPSLRPILQSLLLDPSPCRSDEARAELRAMAAYPPSWHSEAA